MTEDIYIDPHGWSAVQLGDLFTEAQLQHIEHVCKIHNLETAIKELRPYFEGMRDQLEAKGLLPEYAAYAIPYFIKRQL